MVFDTSTLARRYLSQAHNALLEGDYGAAKSMAEAAIKLNPGFFQAHNTLGICFSIDKDFVKALACFDASLAIQPNQTEANINRVSVLEILGEQLNLKPLDLKSMPYFGNETMGLAIFVREEENND